MIKLAAEVRRNNKGDNLESEIKEYRGVKGGGFETVVQEETVGQENFFETVYQEDLETVGQADLETVGREDSAPPKISRKKSVLLHVMSELGIKITKKRSMSL